MLLISLVGSRSFKYASTYKCVSAVLAKINCDYTSLSCNYFSVQLLANVEK